MSKAVKLSATGVSTSKSPINVKTRTKPHKTPPHIRKAQILALQTAGMTQNEIASKLGVSRSTIAADLIELRPAKEQVNTLLSDLQSELAELQTPKQIAVNYVALATNANNEAVRVGAQDRVLELRGVITERERLRTKQPDSSANQPMFILPAGCNVAVTFNQSSTTTYSKDAGESLHNSSVVDVTPIESQSDKT